MTPVRSASPRYVVTSLLAAALGLPADRLVGPVVGLLVGRFEGPVEGPVASPYAPKMAPASSSETRERTAIITHSFGQFRRG
jgi:hypothetical protein